MVSKFGSQNYLCVCCAVTLPTRAVCCKRFLKFFSKRKRTVAIANCFDAFACRVQLMSELHDNSVAEPLTTIARLHKLIRQGHTDHPECEAWMSDVDNMTF